MTESSRAANEVLLFYCFFVKNKELFSKAHTKANTDNTMLNCQISDNNGKLSGDSDRKLLLRLFGEVSVRGEVQLILSKHCVFGHIASLIPPL